MRFGLLREVDFFGPVCDAIYAFGGSARRCEVLAYIEQLGLVLFSDIEYEPLPKSGAVRWEITASFARKRLIEYGFLRCDSAHGSWELTDEGWAFSELRCA